MRNQQAATRQKVWDRPPGTPTLRGQAKAWEEGPGPGPQRNWAGEQAWPLRPRQEPRRHPDAVRGEDTLSCTRRWRSVPLHEGFSRHGAPPHLIYLNQTASPLEKGLGPRQLSCLFTPKLLRADNRSDRMDVKSRKI